MINNIQGVAKIAKGAAEKTSALCALYYYKFELYSPPKPDNLKCRHPQAKNFRPPLLYARSFS